MERNGWTTKPKLFQQRFARSSHNSHNIGTSASLNNNNNNSTRYDSTRTSTIYCFIITMAPRFKSDAVSGSNQSTMYLRTPTVNEPQHSPSSSSSNEGTKAGQQQSIVGKVMEDHPFVPSLVMCPITTIPEQMVSFNSVVRVAEVPNSDHFTEEERSQLWYDNAELQSIHKRNRKQAQRYQETFQRSSKRTSSLSPSPSSSSIMAVLGDDCFRGLEIHTGAGFQKVHKNHTLAVCTVLTEQYRQFELELMELRRKQRLRLQQQQHHRWVQQRPTVSDPNNRQSFSRIGLMIENEFYQALSAACTQEALDTATLDAMAAEEYYHHQHDDKNSDSIMTMKRKRNHSAISKLGLEDDDAQQSLRPHHAVALPCLWFFDPSRWFSPLVESPFADSISAVVP